MSDPQVKILIIEDDEKIQKVFQRLLFINQFSVEIATTGAEGLEKARQSKPELILLDIMMPGLDGMIVLQALKSDEITKSIPVLMLTNVDDQHIIKQAISLGAEGFMVKADFTPEIVLNEIRRVISRQ